VDLTQLEQRLRGHVQTLAATPRAPETPEHRRARDYIAAHLRQCGFAVTEHSFQEAGFAGINLLTRPWPDRPDLPLVIVGAHYDTVPHSPGADDNASAVAALLELAAWLGPRLGSAEGYRARLLLAAYDLEEYGLVGSFLHSRQVQRAGAPLRGMVSLEMLAYTDPQPGSQRLPPHLAGHYPDVANFIGVVGNEVSGGLLQVVTEGLKKVGDLPVEFLAVPGNGEVLYETRLSDHASFWDRGFPGLMITDTSFFRNPHYHTADDTPETLDYPFLARVTAGVCEAVDRLLQMEQLPSSG
jgi:Zn-dependent M28 family amino/carboxypeptidase